MQASSLNQETVNDTAKLMMHRLIARLLVRDPLLLDRARVSLDQMSVLFPDRSFVVEWEELLRLPPRQLRVLLTSVARCTDRTEDFTRNRRVPRECRRPTN